MLSTNYLQQIAGDLGFADPKSQVLTAEGYDGVIALLDNIRSCPLPCLILEDKAFGKIDITEGPVDSYSLSLWLMISTDPQISVSDKYQQAYSLVLQLLKLLIRDSIEGLDLSSLSYSKRSAADSVGYEILLTFRVNIDLS